MKMDEYLTKFHRQEILDALKNKKLLISINFDLTNLMKVNEKLYKQMKYNFDDEYTNWKKSTINQISQLIQAEKIQLNSKNLEIEFDFLNHPERVDWPKLTSELFQLVEFKGYVFRSSTPRKLELLREVQCLKCRQKTTIKADRLYDYTFLCTRHCIITGGCDGKMVYTKKEEEVPSLENTIDFQVFKVQELDKFTPKNRYYAVEVEGNLVDTCNIGDTVYVLGTFETRTDASTKEIKRYVIRGIKISKALEWKQSIISHEKQLAVTAWNDGKKRNNDNELEARDELLKGVAPELNNCFILKLALMVVMCTGGRSKHRKAQRLERMTNRDISHILFIGLPGLGKSELIKAASKISYRSIICVGSACTLAGLTASSYKEDKETHVEAGALVLANQGICCIDEFNLLSTRNRGALHDSMEHQKFSFMQASLKVEVNTRCSVIGSMNHKSEQSAEARNKNLKHSAFNIEPSLISRFDFVFFLVKPEDRDFDGDIISAIINSSSSEYKEKFVEWSLERIQSHVIVAKNIACEVTIDAYKLLVNYYKFCKACLEIDESRKTMRLLKSLERLTVGHAKLMLRNKTKLIDALTIIWLTENSWSFGDLIEQENVVLSELPLGPSQKCIEHIFDTLHLSHLKEVFQKEQNEVTGDAHCPLQLNTTIREDAQDKKELKKLFNKTGALKRRSNETKCTENITEDIDDEFPEILKKSFGISRIEDLFTNSDDEFDENIKDSSKVPHFSSDTLSIQHMEDYLLNEESNDSLTNFEVIQDNMSTQNGQILPNFATDTEQSNVFQKPTIPIEKSELIENVDTKRRKKSSEDEDFSIDEMLKDLPHSSKSIAFKNDEETQKKSTSLGFLGRLKTFEFSSQKSQKNEKKSDECPISAISENLQALNNQLAENLIQKGTEQKTTSTPMSREEYLKALDDELDLWN
ncbi:unnamed protein product [Chironomus riparius]|uniref:DNA helicase n=1 Tax=Chironomus riparius TaxID=315576 RepID=A0A9N9RLD2_9DIPT|nr:unnamed protein product [Chironomus riparius]